MVEARHLRVLLRAASHEQGDDKQRDDIMETFPHNFFLTHLHSFYCFAYERFHDESHTNLQILSSGQNPSNHPAH